jgi:hypothetical protein
VLIDGDTIISLTLTIDKISNNLPDVNRMNRASAGEMRTGDNLFVRVGYWAIMD